METLRWWIVVSWIALPTVMYGGYALLGLLTQSGELTEFRRSMFRAGHAHAGVLHLLALLYYIFIDLTTLAPAVKMGAASILFVGILAQSGGFFVHMARGAPGVPSIGSRITTAGASLLVLAVLVLVYGLIVL